ncbi:proline/glycine betaine ABC transporter permease [Thalassococcus sp. S3]|uniref:ABC transporter permease n=1 Tax=Thalassococcus sp. S3 TaxID=2017482 RepID=UPI0010241F34|nr:ABC transporter permease subunit [Thalassococcus sp. S3]QBF33326.1 glycine/betaine ABC transporter permease [Thalassococcus sp. S3]
MEHRLQPAIWLGLALLTLLLTFGAQTVGALVKFPDDWVLSPAVPMNIFMDWFVSVFGPIFKAIGWLLEWPIVAARWVLTILPWSATVVAFVLIAWIGSGWRLAAFVGVALLYMGAIGYWQESMNTLAIVLISVPMAVALGFAVGVWGFYSERARQVIMPTLDLLQTIPAFAYLLPILILFGFGTTVGLVASILYAFSPMVRNTILGLRAVPEAITEAGLMSGATPSQLFWKVRLPAAQNQMLLGVNQTTMASLSMVIIASIIGGTNDIGWEVLSTMRKAQFGESVLAGFVIALMAMALDRITYAFATRDKFAAEKAKGPNPWVVLAVGMAAMIVLSLIIPALRVWPEALTFNPAAAMNAGLESLVVNGREWIEAIKNSSFFFVMLPIKIGLENAISPFTWGFAMSPLVAGVYAVIVLGLAVWAFVRERRTLAAIIVLVGVILFVGLTNMPWLALSAIVTYGAYVAAGRTLAIGTALALAFLVISGIWPQAVLSLYLCGVAVLCCFVFGTGLGILASENDIVSALLRPILDTLQTMPLFVILIPFVMVFKIGEFTALLAVIAYAIVPAIRYTEHGLRNLPKDVIEAATTVGATRLQLLTRVKLPLALPAIMLGLNQTIIYGIGMLVIAALVGTNGLGQQIYIGLGDGDFGVGMTAGIGMAIIAIIADRITQAISRRRQEELGLKLEGV